MNYPANTRHGGVFLFYKTSLPINIRTGLIFSLQCFFNHNSTEFANFISNFTNVYSIIKNGNPFAAFFNGDLNGHSEARWPDGDSTPEGREIDDLLTFLGLSQTYLNQQT